MAASITMPKADKRGWWPHGFTNVQWARKGIGYLVKDATKTASALSPFPKGCRLQGHGGLSSERRLHRAWWMLPKYQRERCESGDRVRRAPGGAGGQSRQVNGGNRSRIAFRAGNYPPSPLSCAPASDPKRKFAIQGRRVCPFDLLTHNRVRAHATQRRARPVTVLFVLTHMLSLTPGGTRHENFFVALEYVGTFGAVQAIVGYLDSGSEIPASGTIL